MYYQLNKFKNTLLFSLGSDYILWKTWTLNDSLLLYMTACLTLHCEHKQRGIHLLCPQHKNDIWLSLLLQLHHLLSNRRLHIKLIIDLSFSSWNSNNKWYLNKNLISRDTLGSPSNAHSCTLNTSNFLLNYYIHRPTDARWLEQFPPLLFFFNLPCHESQKAKIHLAFSPLLQAFTCLKRT